MLKFDEKMIFVTNFSQNRNPFVNFLSFSELNGLKYGEKLNVYILVLMTFAAFRLRVQGLACT